MYIVSIHKQPYSHSCVTSLNYSSLPPILALHYRCLIFPPTMLNVYLLFLLNNPLLKWMQEKYEWMCVWYFLTIIFSARLNCVHVHWVLWRVFICRQKHFSLWRISLSSAECTAALLLVEALYAVTSYFKYHWVIGMDWRELGQDWDVIHLHQNGWGSKICCVDVSSFSVRNIAFLVLSSKNTTNTSL